MGSFLNLGDYLDPIARIWGGGETNFTVSVRGRKEVKKEVDSPEIKEAAAESNKNKLPEDEKVK